MPQAVTTLKEIETNALRLSDDDRAELVSVLMRSLISTEGWTLSPEWVAEAERRDREMEASGERGEPADKVLAEMRALLG